jgi:lipoprotein-releasing system permease protein
MKLALSIAWRFLSSAKRQTFIIILGISVGVSVQVFIGSLISGLQKSLVDTTIGSASHVTIFSEDARLPISDYQLVIDELEQNDENIKVVSPVFDLPGILEKDELKREILFRGFNFDRANQIYKFDDKLVEGNMPVEVNDILLGIELKESLDLEIGEFITIEIIGQNRTLKVVGFFDFNVSVINRTWGVGIIETLQDIVNNSNAVTAIEMQIGDVFMAETLALSLSSRLSSEGLITQDWMTENQELLSGLEGQSISSLMIQVFVIISVVLGISSVLAITVMQKSKQIGILKAMGIKDRDASLVFLLEGFILGIFGAIGGVLLGLGLSFSFTTFALNPDGTPVVPLNLELNFIILSALIALFASTFAALIPAIKSSKLTVIEVIRNA